MGVGAPQLPTAKPSRGTLAVYLSPPRFSLRGYHPLRRGFPAHFGYRGSGLSSIDGLNTTSPHGYPVRIWFELSPFRSPLLRGSLLVSLPPPTKMFPFGGFPSSTPRLPGFPGCHGFNPWQEFPFGDPGFNGCLRLPQAYRRLPRPSSAPKPSHPPSGFLPRSGAGLVCIGSAQRSSGD